MGNDRGTVVREADTRPVASDAPRIAVVSLHTSPLDQPGSGDSGGMNVFIRAAAERLSEGGLQVDVFTRTRDERRPEVEELGNGSRLINVQAGPSAPVPKDELRRFLPEFLGGVLRRARAEGSDYDLVHTHYWLSGWVGRSAREIWGVPLVASFHTLGKVKNYSLSRGERPEPADRLSGEELVIADADRIVAATPVEAAQLVACTGPNPTASASSPRASITACSSLEIGAGPRRGCTSRICGCCCSSDACRRTRAPTWPSARSPRRSPVTRPGPVTSCSPSSAVRAAPTTAPRWPG
jgi:hypothetical protein